MIQTTLVLLSTWAVVRALRRQSAAERHLVWMAGLCSAVLVPGLSVMLAAWHPHWIRTVTDLLPPLVRPVAQPLSSGNADVLIRAGGIEESTGIVGRMAALLWAVGAVWLLSTLACRMRRLQQLRDTTTPILDPSWHELAAEVSRHLRVRRPVALFYSSSVAIPLTWGVRNPRVIFPTQAAGWHFEQRRAVLAHELAHVHRCDWATQLVSQLLCAVYWFHPLFWLGARQLRHESERACDDVVVGLGVDANEYAAHLLSVVRNARSIGNQWRSALAAARPGELEQRFAALLDLHGPRRPVSRRRAGVVAILTAALGLPLAAAGVAPFERATVRVRSGTYPTALDTATMERTVAPQAIRGVRAVGVASRDAANVPPQVLEYSTPPLYSEDARRRGVEGIVTIEARVGIAGRVSAPRIVKGLGFGLDENALVALRQWQFRPGERSGVPVEMDAQIDLEFNLRNEALNELIANDMATRIGADVTPPRIIRTVAVASSSVDRELGTVALDVVLLEDGRPKIVRVLHSATASLDERAIDAFEQWRFSPAMKAGRPVKVRLQAEITFH